MSDMRDTSDKLQFDTFEQARHGAGLARVQATAFGISPADVEYWWEKCGNDALRVVRRAESVLGGLIVLAMGQFFVGRRLSMAGIAGVAVAAEHRAEGVGGFLMREMLRDLYENGYALSALFPAAYPFYRRAGYEHAGVFGVVRVPLGQLRPCAGPTPGVRPLGDGDLAAVKELYRTRAASSNGYLDRNEYIWERVRNPRTGAAEGYAFDGESELEGYLYLQSHRDSSTNLLHLHVTDWAAKTRRAAERLLTFLANHSAQAESVSWHGGPHHPQLFLLPDRDFQLSVKDIWMLRLVNLPVALELRGYPSGLTVELHLEVSDDILAENNGRFLLEVRDGAARVRRGGEGRVRTDIGALAALFSGHLSATTLALAGRLHASPQDQESATALFAAVAPSLVDSF